MVWDHKTNKDSTYVKFKGTKSQETKHCPINQAALNTPAISADTNTLLVPVRLSQAVYLSEVDEGELECVSLETWDRLWAGKHWEHKDHQTTTMLTGYRTDKSFQELWLQITMVPNVLYIATADLPA